LPQRTWSSIAATKRRFTAEIAETAEKRQKKQKFKGAEKRYNALKKKEL